MELKNRKLEVAMARLRLGHTRLRAHMCRMKLVDSPNCWHCRVPETIEVFLVSCHRYYGARCILLGALARFGINNLDIHISLGGGDISLDEKCKIAEALKAYLLKTGKFNDLWV